MADVFARTELNFGGAFAADIGLIVPDPAHGISGVLLQGLQVSYSQQVARIYEIGNASQRANMYYVGGRSQGGLSVNHVVGPAVSMMQFYTSFSDVCKAGSNNLKLQLQRPGCNSDTDGNVSSNGQVIAYMAKYCVLTQIGVAVGAQDLVVNESSQVMFGNLQYTESVVA